MAGRKLILTKNGRIRGKMILDEDNVEAVERIKEGAVLLGMTMEITGDTPWEDAAKWAISSAIDAIEWQPQNGVVVVPKFEMGLMGNVYTSCYSFNSLLEVLRDVGLIVWIEKIKNRRRGPRNMSKVIDVRGMLLERCGVQLVDMGWV